MTSSPVYQCKRALIIGINTYQNNSLNYCINDAKDLMTTLNRIGFKEVLLGVDCKRTKFLQMVETFAGRIKPTDLTLFYFSGHGKQYENENYLLPSDYDYDYSTRESIYLLDNAVSVQTNVRTKGGSDQQGLSPMHASPETLIAYACAPGAVAVDETRNGRNGYFAEHLLKHIATPNNDIEDILKIVAREVKLQTSGFQVPFRTSSLTEKVCLVTSNVQGQYDSPFLNRFEKHTIDIQTLIHERHWLLSRELYGWLENCLPNNLGSNFPLLQHLFVDYSQDQLCSLVIEACEQLNISTDDENTPEKNLQVINYCQEKLLRAASFDLPLTLSTQTSSECQNLIQQYYEMR
ncbi:unnamed protein product, partial [Rotaria socialis]